MIKEFQTIWDSNHKKMMKAISQFNFQNSDFNEYNNQRNAKKVEIQIKKNQHQRSLTQLSKKSQLTVKKIVALIELENQRKTKNLN